MATTEPEEYDEALQSAIAELGKALDAIPHGVAKTLSDPIDELIAEARWLNVQRNSARKERDRIVEAYENI